MNTPDTPVCQGGGPNGAAAELLERVARPRSPLSTGDPQQRGLHLSGLRTTGKVQDFTVMKTFRYDLLYKRLCTNLRSDQHFVSL